jgi:hypothetical protein
MSPTIKTEIKKPKSKVFRNFHVKRRQTSDGLFESTWQNLSTDVKKWGTLKKGIDDIGYNRVRFSDLNITVANDHGKYNPETDLDSFWYGFANQQRSLVRIQAGFTHQTLGSDGIWTNTNLPADPSIFFGVIQGNISLSDNNEVVLPVKPLLQVFRDFSTRNLVGLSNTGLTASRFIELLRDQTDGSANFIFRPFFQDTTTFWEFTSSSIVYKDLNPTIVSAMPSYDPAEPEQNDFLELSVWDVLERLGEAENLVPRIMKNGTFRFADRTRTTSTAAFEFYGKGFFNTEYGHTIKKINSYQRKVSDYYSRVEVKWLSIATTTAVASTQTAMSVSGTNNAWLYGHRTFSVENLWIATDTSAQTLVNTLFAQVSTIPFELDFSTSFVPQLDVLDLVNVSYDSSDAQLQSRWDLADWAEDATESSSDLIWAYPEGDAISFNSKEFKLNSIEVNLDKLECRFVGFAI